MLAYNGAEIRFFWQLSGSDSLQVVNKRKNAFSPLKINLALIYSGEGLDDGGTDQTERRRINTTAEQSRRPLKAVHKDITSYKHGQSEFRGTLKLFGAIFPSFDH